MANSQYQYVKEFERENILLPETFIVVRVDGRGFHRFSKFYEFAKPNDRDALQCMNMAAIGVMKNVPDIILGYGDSDEYSFVFNKHTELFQRREAKLVSTIVSTFTAHYIQNWPSSKKSLTVHHLPTFDGRAVVYPNEKALRDYISWRQVDCHINNLYNTTFWTLVEKGGMSPHDAEARLCGTVSGDKNEILFSQFGINYNNEPEEYRKGTALRWAVSDSKKLGAQTGLSQRQHERKVAKTAVEQLHIDLIKNDGFWVALFQLM